MLGFILLLLLLSWIGRRDTDRAWMIPGMYPRMVKQILIKRSAPQPLSRKTPIGGRMMARMILQMSLLRQKTGLRSVVISSLKKQNRGKNNDLRSGKGHFGRARVAREQETENLMLIADAREQADGGKTRERRRERECCGEKKKGRRKREASDKQVFKLV